MPCTRKRQVRTEHTYKINWLTRQLPYLTVLLLLKTKCAPSSRQCTKTKRRFKRKIRLNQVYKILRMLCGNIKFKPGRGTRGQEATGRRDTLACRVWLVFTASKHQAYYSYFGVILLNNSIENIKPGHCEEAR